jgi:alkyldihydroxyacetonephosphate synthase
VAVEPLRGAPTPPIPLGGAGRPRLDAARVAVDDTVLARLEAVCPIEVDPSACAEASRDWWPLAMHWALDGEVGGVASAIARPTDAAQVGDVLALCDDARVPVTAAGGRSGVCGASLPVHGGVVLDLTSLAGVSDVDDASLIVDVGPGTFGDVLEDEMHAYGYTVGHWPQSIQLSTVGGWLACRGAGQMSNRYGKIEDIVVGLDVALADGRRIHTGGHARAAVGPDLTQLFVGSEGTLGVITGARLRVHPAPLQVASAAYGFGDFSAANEACRRIMARGARPAIVRTYDPAESARSFDTGDCAVLLVRDEGDPELVAATMAVVAGECEAADVLDAGLVDRWWDRRNDVSALEALTTRGYVVDTLEVTAPWRAIAAVYDDVRAAVGSVEHVVVATAHQSHAYTDGACLYFTFAAQPPPDERERTYVTAWDAGTRAALAAGASLSHHHGVGLNRSRFVRAALGPAFDVLVAVKSALDPHGILNPGKLGLPDPFGEVPWP